MDELKEMLLSQLLTSRNMATLSEDSRQVMKLKSGTQLAYRMCDKTLAIKMRKAEFKDFQVTYSSGNLTNKKQEFAHFDTAYFDI